MNLIPFKLDIGLKLQLSFPLPYPRTPFLPQPALYANPLSSRIKVWFHPQEICRIEFLISLGHIYKTEFDYYSQLSVPSCPFELFPKPSILFSVLIIMCFSPMEIYYIFYSGSTICYFCYQFYLLLQTQSIIAVLSWLLSLNFYKLFQLHNNSYTLIIKLQARIECMYNRFQHQKQQAKLQKRISDSKSFQKLDSLRKNSNQKMSERYKQRIRDFLVKITSKPVILGQYQPPITNIMRNPESDKILANAQLFINGFKTNKQRLANAVQQNKILDLSPAKSTALLHEFRQRQIKAQIQPGMRFAGRSSSQTKLPSISHFNMKLRFKAVEQMGNNLKSMKQKQLDEIGLVNRLQTVSGGKQFDHVTFSIMALRQSKLLKTKYIKTK